MKICEILIALLLGLHAQPASAQTYVPLGSWVDRSAVAFESWNLARVTSTQEVFGASPSQRPIIAGISNHNLELLVDALIRNRPDKLQGSVLGARQVILKQASSNLHQFRGYMAEALFLDRHPDWRYVRSRTASQNDVTTFRPGRKTPWNGQVKYHYKLNSQTMARYAAEMRVDDKANRFFIPDDHVEPMKQYLKMKADDYYARGMIEEYHQAHRHRGRLEGLGYTSTEVHRKTMEAIRAAACERAVGYASLGASLILALSFTTHGLVTGRMTMRDAARQFGHLGILLGSATLSEWVLAKVMKAAWSGTMKGNVVTGSILAVVDVLWLLDRHGWSAALSKPEFYVELAGNVSALVVGLIAFKYTAVAVSASTAPVMGPYSVFIGAAAGLLVGSVAGVLAQFLGREAARIFLEVFAPNMYYRHENERMAAVKNHLLQETLASRSFEPIPLRN